MPFCRALPAVRKSFRGAGGSVRILKGLLGGSCDLVSKVISTLIGVISIVTLIIALVTKSHDPSSRVRGFRV